MTKNQENKILKNYQNCTNYDLLAFPIYNFDTFKDCFFNAVLGRRHLEYTLEDVCSLLKTSKRNAIELEKGNSNNLNLVIQYIRLFNFDFALDARRKAFFSNYKDF